MNFVLTGGVLYERRVTDEADVLARERPLDDAADLRPCEVRVLLLHPPRHDRLIRAVHHVTYTVVEITIWYILPCQIIDSPLSIPVCIGDS